MPTFKYVGDPGRYYVDLRITPKPDEPVELDKDPGDGRWVPVTGSDTSNPPAPAPGKPATDLAALQAAAQAAEDAAAQAENALHDAEAAQEITK